MYDVMRGAQAVCGLCDNDSAVEIPSRLVSPLARKSWTEISVGQHDLAGRTESVAPGVTCDSARNEPRQIVGN